MLKPEQIERGIVVRLDPEILSRCGARTDRTGGSPVEGVHYFVCTVRVSGVSVWIPAFSRWVPGRIRLRWKGGDPAWVAQDSFVDLAQQWLVPDTAIGPASGSAAPMRGYQMNRASLFFLLGQHLDGDPRPQDPASPRLAA